MIFHFMHIPEFIIPSDTDGYLGSFYLLTVGTNSTVNVGEEISSRSYFQFFTRVVRRLIAG